MADDTGFQLTRATDAMLSELSERNGLSKAAFMELLISHAYAVGWSVLFPFSSGASRADELIDFNLLKNRLSDTAFA